PPCSSYAMRALRLGGWSAPGGGRGMARATPGAATAGKTRERRHGARSFGPAAATVAAAVLELRNASIALWLGGPRGAAAAQNRG
ncbi:TPA: hypothetical protein ACF6X2_006812, partial [Burkholderia cenocepacia]